MRHVLTISRVTVAPEHEAEYIQTVHRLSRIAAARSQHLWLFRSTVAPQSYLEFSESRTEMAHRVRASRTDMEERLEHRLREIAVYAPGAWDLWEEVPVPQDEPSA